jgi:hypothetical protein
MTHRTNHRNIARINRPRQHLLVERPQILQRTTTPTDYHAIHTTQSIRIPVHQPNRTRHLTSRSLALNPHRIHQQLNHRPTSPNRLYHVPNRCPRRTRHNHNTLRKPRQPPLPLTPKQTLLFKLLTHLTKRKLQRTNTQRLHPTDIQLITTAPLKHINMTRRNDLHPVRRVKLHPASRRPPHYTRQLAARILQHKIQVTTRMTLEIAQLTHNMQRRRQMRLDRILHQLRHPRHCQPHRNHLRITHPHFASPPKCHTQPSSTPNQTNTDLPTHTRRNRPSIDPPTRPPHNAKPMDTLCPILASIPIETFLWLTIPPIVMAIIALVHSLKHWNKEQ